MINTGKPGKVNNLLTKSNLINKGGIKPPISRSNIKQSDGQISQSDVQNQLQNIQKVAIQTPK